MPATAKKTSNVRAFRAPAKGKTSSSPKAAQSNAQVAHALASMLATTYTLYQKTLFYHWNVTGPHFISLHKLFETHYNELQTASDDIAERIRALDHFAPGTSAEFTGLSAISEDKRLPDSAQGMVKNLLAAHEAASQAARNTHDVAEQAEDVVTVDMMVERMTYHDKTAWMLRSWLA